MPGLILLLLVAAAYFPAFRGEFIWDDDYNVIKSKLLRSMEGLLRIWFEPGATQQYYPLTHTSFWLDYHLWGLHPMAYHVENVLLHALGAILVWRVLRRLDVRGAWLGAALFAVHPVCVESVAWITERKNTLCVVFFLLSLLAAIEFWLPCSAIPARKAPAARNDPAAKFGLRRFYWMALVLYVCALWSKTATVGLPVVILLLAWWKRGRLIRRDVLLIVPFLAVGAGMALITLSIERRLVLIGGVAEEWRFLPFERSLIAARALWFYLGKLCWPHPLMFMYPRWQLEAVSWPGYVAVLATGAVVFMLWRRRNQWARPALVALAYFFIMLFPLLGFFNGVFFRYSFVCDHFQYLACLGPLALAAAGITSLLNRLAASQPLVRHSLCAILLLGLSLLTWRQTAVYYSLETLWRNTLEHNPDSWMAHANLGNYLCQSKRFDEAETHYRRAIELRPNDYVVYYDLGLKAAIQGDLDQAIQYFEKTLQIDSGYALAYFNLGNIWSRKGDLDEAILQYRKAVEADSSLALTHFNLGNALARKGNLDEAIQEYSTTCRLDPDFVAAPITLGNLLAAKGKPDEAVAAYNKALEIQADSAPAHAALGRVLAARGDLDQAIGHYQKALEIEPNSVDALANLGNALVKQGRFDEALTSYRSALRLDPKSPALHYNLAVALTRIGDSAQAQAEWAQAKQLEAEHALERR
jgi:tetratricopeptide (TPR) repeat protein